MRSEEWPHPRTPSPRAGRGIFVPFGSTRARAGAPLARAGILRLLRSQFRIKNAECRIGPAPVPPPQGRGGGFLCRLGLPGHGGGGAANSELRMQNWDVVVGLQPTIGGCRLHRATVAAGDLHPVLSCSRLTACAVPRGLPAGVEVAGSHLFCSVFGVLWVCGSGKVSKIAR